MNIPPIYNILMYSHDTYGLGHIRRTMAIANHLRDAQTNILILTGSPIAGRFSFPEQVDFVRIPGMVKKTNDEYQPLSIRIDQEQALKIRTNIIKATAKTFQPDLFIVDKEPLGLKREVLPTLKWLKKNLPASRTVLGLRDILDDSKTIQKDWKQKRVYHYLETLYDEIWVYGERNIYDPITEYRIPPRTHNKVFFTGYIPREKIADSIRSKIRKQFRILDDDTFLLVTTGGGGDGSEVLDNYLLMHEYFPTSLPFKSIIITGPFMPKKKRQELRNRAKRHGIETLPFHPRLEDLMKASDLVISMGGYNTFCEILTQKTPALIIPRESPRQEQLIRARCMKEQGLIEYIPWNEVSPTVLREKIVSILSQATTLKKNMSSFQLSGLDIMLQRLESFKRLRTEALIQP